MGIRTYLTASVKVKSQITGEDVVEKHSECVCFGKNHTMLNFATNSNDDDGTNCPYLFDDYELDDFFDELDMTCEENQMLLNEWRQFKETDLFKKASSFELSVW